MTTNLRASGAALLALVLVLAASACGSQDATPTTTAAATPVTWAGGVCSAILTWKAAVVDAGQTVRADPSKDSVQQGLDALREANTTFADSVKALESPNLASVDKVQTTLKNLQTQIDGDVSTIQDTLDAMTLTNARTSAQTITTTIKTMGQQFTSAADSLRSLQGGELSQAFKDAPACQKLPGGSASTESQG